MLRPELFLPVEGPGLSPTVISRDGSFHVLTPRDTTRILKLALPSIASISESCIPTSQAITFSGSNATALPIIHLSRHATVTGCDKMFWKGSTGKFIGFGRATGIEIQNGSSNDWYKTLRRFD